MSNATFAAVAIDAINYSDNDDEESSESEEVRTSAPLTSLAMTPTTMRTVIRRRPCSFAMPGTSRTGHPGVSGLFIERIAKLADKVVSIFCHADARILAHRRLTSPFLPRPSSPSHRSTLRAGSVPTMWATTAS